MPRLFCFLLAEQGKLFLRIIRDDDDIVKKPADVVVGGDVITAHISFLRETTINLTSSQRHIRPARQRAFLGKRKPLDDHITSHY